MHPDEYTLYQSYDEDGSVVFYQFIHIPGSIPIWSYLELEHIKVLADYVERMFRKENPFLILDKQVFVVSGIEEHFSEIE